MSSAESDVETHMDSPKKPSKIPKIPSKVVMELQYTKKLSTKDMINKALSESKSRKGQSLYAIKKYMQVNFGVDVEKINYLIKKNIKESVESGTIIQTKGIGASGSFRLAPGSKQPKKPLKRPKKPEEATKNEKKSEKPNKSSSKNIEDSKPMKKVAKTVKEESKTKSSTIKDNQKPSKTKPSTIKGNQKPSKTKPSTIEDNQKPGTSYTNTPKKKSTLMKRKSIGSIIKKPKMKPAKA
ncbi:histone H1.0-A-like [Maniola hyperantus]|uniref:histone H1.0-A-like n=1 Tax=Aphantopus hyperantus TaxID=2795564 RepID=UPI0015695128|nr:histone H1.1, embryonic-like [Maniola hyperantus]